MEYICHVKELSVTCIMLYISGKIMAGEKSKSVLLARRLEEAMLEQLVLIPYNIGALKIYETTQRRRRTIPVWKVVQSPQQPTNVECGFYVMRYMKDLIRDQSILRKQNFNGKKTYTETELDEVRVEWINFILKNMS
ncbi:uncharacterized protein LOC114269344 isoform X2 [Camellia sinensis]|uniref:uncharacterized protein LOC114269344 isoform X2 n=1 Tax=Camellia sinensis TaxID=4442 RepID=UPI001035C9F2|nr:uncharacterized protein LOC114269344 isoform X2 [Camellia sinensis]